MTPHEIAMAQPAALETAEITPPPDPMTPEGQQAIIDRLTRGDADDTAEAL